MKIKYAYLFYVLLYFILALATLNFNYVEGDDASTILHHVFGRNADLQPVYSPYHSMLDTLLSLVPSQNEMTLRYISVGVSFLAGFFVFIFLTKILKDHFHKQEDKLTYFLLALPFIIPDALFNSLLINSANISFALLLLSHILFNKYLNTKHYFFLILSVLVFGFGVSFRWNNGFYLFVLFGIYILNVNKNSKDENFFNQLKESFLIFPFFVVSVLGFIQISGYSIFDIVAVYKSGSSYLEETDFSMLAMAASAISFITPAFLGLFILGLINCLRDKKYLPLYLIVIATLPYFVLGIYPYYKYLICLMVPIILIQVYGFFSIKRNVFKIVLGCIIFSPWVFGLQIQSSSAWGPGFEINTKESSGNNVHSFNPDKSTKIENVKLNFGSGMAMPTPEGPRPLYGFGKVLLTDWYHFIKINNIEREASVNYAIDNNCNILQDVNHSLIASKFSELGYVYVNETNVSNSFGIHRTFYRETDSVSIDIFKDKKELFNSQLMNSHLLKQKINKVVVYSTYTNIITKLQSKYQNRFKQQGAFWGILILNE